MTEFAPFDWSATELYTIVIGDLSVDPRPCWYSEYRADPIFFDPDEIGHYLSRGDAVIVVDNYAVWEGLCRDYLPEGADRRWHRVMSLSYEWQKWSPGKPLHLQEFYDMTVLPKTSEWHDNQIRAMIAWHLLKITDPFINEK